MKTISVRGVKEGVTQFHTVGDVVTFTNVEEGDDDYHTFDQLYAHRMELFLALWRSFSQWSGQLDRPRCWRSLYHADGTMFEGMFVAGMDFKVRREIDGDVNWVPVTVTYHYHLQHWGRFDIKDEYNEQFSVTLDRAPAWDGHTEHDVLARLAEFEADI